MLTIRERVRDLSEPERQVYETRAEQFEASWSRPVEGEPEIALLLPGAEPVRTLLLVHLAKCDMDFRGQRGEPRRVEDYLARFPELAADPAARLELLLWEYRLTRTTGARLEDCERRFPDLAAELRAAAIELEPPRPWVPPAEYDIEEPPIGEGGWGVVYRARNKRLDRIEALKLVDPRLAGSQRGRLVRARIERLRGEIPIAARLNHSNIVHLYRDGESNGHPYFVMEYCAGGNLATRLGGRPLPAAEAAALIQTLAKAVDAVHEFGLIHRDLKPSNVLFGDRDVAKIADFGLALPLREGEDALPLTEIAGTPAYMAPEQADPSRGPIERPTDVYGMGAVLYECLTGRPPFAGEDGSKVLSRVLHDLPAAPRQLNPQVPRDLEAVCLKCLEKDPHQRYPTARELAEDLGRFLAGAPVRARRHSPVRHARHWVRTNPIKVIVALVLLLAVATVFKLQLDAREREVQQANDQREQAERVAEVERKRAEAERQAAHAALVTAARQRARVGAWADALVDYDRAIRDGEPDALRLRVERLVGFFALNRAADLTAELDALGQTELGELAAQLKLMRAAWLMCDSAQQSKGRALAREALVDRSQLFSPANAAFAEALAAERVGQAIAALHRAVDADPLHYLAATSLAVALAAVGDRAEAVRQVRFLRGVFPYSPAPDLTEALLAFVEDDREALKGKLAGMAEKLPPDRRPAVARLEKFLLVVSDLRELAIRFSAGEELDAARAQQLVQEVRQAGGMPNPEPLGLPVPAFSLVYLRLLEVVPAYVEVGLSVKLGLIKPNLLERLQTLNADYPDAGLLLLAALAHCRLASGPINQGDIVTARKHLQAAADLSARATRAPSLVPRSPVSYLARGLGMVSDLSVLKLVRQPDEVHLQHLREGLHLLISEGRKWPKIQQSGIEAFILLMTAPLTPQQCGDWNLSDPAGQQAFAKRLRDLAGLGRALLDDWAIDEPDNPTIPKLREDLAKWAASSGVLEVNQPPSKK